MAERSRSIWIVLAFLSIYLIWGSTYLAIKVVVSTVPPFFAAAVRFLIAGPLLLGMLAVRQRPRFAWHELRNAAILAALMFGIAYGGVFWVEQSIPSGLVSVIVATIPVWTAILERVLLKKRRPLGPLLCSIGLGLAGVLLLSGEILRAGLPLLPCLVLLGTEVAWSLGTVLSGVLRLPASKPAGAAALEMTLGGVMLAACSLLIGETKPWPQVSLNAWIGILYLAIPGSILAFTAYVWLLGKMPPSVVASYAYVNPAVALWAGHWFGNESVGPRVILGSALILGGVIVTLTARGSLKKVH